MGGCNGGSSDLEAALKAAGENRGELEKVLEHYSKEDADSLKLQAARFLIENMRGHYTLRGKLIDKYRRLFYADTAASYFAKRCLEMMLDDVGILQQGGNHQEDLECVTAEFLIRHIDKSFERLDAYPWLADVPFEMFLEYLLPYRVGHERLELWIDSLGICPDTLSGIRQSGANEYFINKDIKKLPLTNSSQDFTQRQLRRWFSGYIYSNCLPAALRDYLKCKAAFLPAAIDFIPYYANRNGFHCWSTMVSPEVKIIEEDWSRLERRAAKIYRKTFSRHVKVESACREFVPELFRDPFFVDVTDNYLHTANVEIPVCKPTNRTNRYAYLCVCSIPWIGNRSLFPILIERERCLRHWVRMWFIFLSVTMERRKGR